MNTASPEINPQDCINQWSDEEREGVEGYRPMDLSEIPDEYFSDAWRHKKNQIVVDMPAALEIHQNNLRAQREPLLAKLDTEFMRAVEAKDEAKQAAIAAKKQELRDVTKHPRVLKANTPEMLKAAVPEVLTEPLGF